MRLRLMSYNVHRCIGPDGADSTAYVAEVVAEAKPDVVALQELDAPSTDEAEGVHHARDIAAPLGMNVLFCRTIARGEGHYGHALLSRFPLELNRSTTLPFDPDAHTEPRGAIWARIDTPVGPFQVVSTHLGVTRAERRAQSRVLLGPEWIGSGEFTGNGVVCGDLNAIPPATTYRRFARLLRDAQRCLEGHRPRPTFPSRFPLLRIDHVFVTSEVRVRDVLVPKTSAARRASDHLPLIVDLELVRAS